MPLTPKNRNEEWLQGLVDHETTLTPKNRPEAWMKEIIDASGGGGTGGGVLVATATVDDGSLTLDKTWKELKDAPFSVVRIQIADDGGVSFGYISDITAALTGDYIVAVYNLSEGAALNFVASSANDYPAAEL